jgi:hypothetical protein
MNGEGAKPVPELLDFRLAPEAEGQSTSDWIAHRRRVLEDSARFRHQHPETAVFFPVLAAPSREIETFLQNVAGLHKRGEFPVPTVNACVYMALPNGKVLRVHVAEVE